MKYFVLATMLATTLWGGVAKADYVNDYGDVEMTNCKSTFVKVPPTYQTVCKVDSGRIVIFGLPKDSTFADPPFPKPKAKKVVPSRNYGLD